MVKTILAEGNLAHNELTGTNKQLANAEMTTNELEREQRRIYALEAFSGHIHDKCRCLFFIFFSMFVIIQHVHGW